MRLTNGILRCTGFSIALFGIRHVWQGVVCPPEADFGSMLAVALNLFGDALRDALDPQFGRSM